ncbi:DDE-type integrase/transposase/recombinase [Candidatus Woesebacteria bacterium]|nr:DDE-type integrase/transposase/recombinase [Candidatus Woesebacteria bacterium]
MNDSQIRTIQELKKFLQSTCKMTFQRQSQAEAYNWIKKVLKRFQYFRLKKLEKGMVQGYIKHMTRYSKSQVTRLIAAFFETEDIRPLAGRRYQFPTKYSQEELRLLARTDELHGFPNAASLKYTLGSLSRHDTKFQKIAEVSVTHVYNLRKSSRYHKFTRWFQKTKSSPTGKKIGLRQKPQPDGRPGYLRVDTIHQGDQNGVKGVYHINTIDEITQFEFIAAIEQITQDILLPILRQLIDSYPFKIFGFHADNGSEYINQFVIDMLNTLLIQLTKSRPRHSNDNALIETKNGPIIRKWIGYAFIDQRFACDLNEFYFGSFNEYLNYHRPCAFPSIKKDSKGKLKKIYPFENYKTPYEKLKSLPRPSRHLKPGLSFDALDKQYLCKNPNQQAEIVNTQRDFLFKKINSR